MFELIRKLSVLIVTLCMSCSCDGISNNTHVTDSESFSQDFPDELGKYLFEALKTKDFNLYRKLLFRRDEYDEQKERIHFNELIDEAEKKWGIDWDRARYIKTAYMIPSEKAGMLTTECHLVIDFQGYEFSAKFDAKKVGEKWHLTYMFVFLSNGWT